VTSLVDISVTIWVIGIPVALLTLFLFDWRKGVIVAALSVGVSGFFFLAQPDLQVPVKGATRSDWNPKSFWCEPWGKSIVHRGIDIFAKAGTDVISPSGTLVIYAGENPVSGKLVLAIDRSLRIHFFAHLQSIKTEQLAFLDVGEAVGTVGDSGNAKGKPPHLHYGLASTIPRPWLITSQTLGQLRAFYLNPETHFSF
jgi:murein DD-endopeptidase MepM/ murein hydrolase activator NlpD